MGNVLRKEWICKEVVTRYKGQFWCLLKESCENVYIPLFARQSYLSVKEVLHAAMLFQTSIYFLFNCQMF